MIGNHLSHYHIVEELGRGGMGIVYRAEDTKLDRTVAIKVLPPSALTSDDDRARFYREAKAAAALNHPNIAQIYEIDEAVPSGAPHGTPPSPFIAMEYIDGETLDARIKKGPVKLEDAVRIATEATDALNMAHEKGIVHRDVKSANIMLDEKDRVKILDFGLALTAASTKLTRMGSTLGTVAYMSPEQARGEEVDNRTDLWALGVVLYEMIAGRNPFGGDYEQAVVYSILNEEVEPLTALRTGVPMSLEWIVSKCLAKSAGDRYQTAGDLLVDLRTVDLSNASVLRSTASRTSVRRAEPDERPREQVNWRTAAAGVLIGLVVMGISWWISGSSVEKDTRVVRSQINLPLGMTLEPGKAAPLAIDRTAIALSPDGRSLVLVGSYGETTALYHRDMATNSFERIPGTEGAYGVTLSPDGSAASFFADDLLKVVALSGGSPRELASVSLPYDKVWLEDGTIVFSNDEGGSLVRVPSSGGPLETLYFDLEDPQETTSVDLSLDDVLRPRSVLPTGEVLAIGNFGTYALDMNTLTGRTINQRLNRAWVSPDEYLLNVEGEGISIRSWKGDQFEYSNATVTAVERLYQRTEVGGAHFTTDAQGTLVYVDGPNLSRTRLHWLQGAETAPLPNFNAALYGDFSLSPDGKQIAITVREVGATNIWIHDLERGTRTNVSKSGFNMMPTWSADGEHLYWGAIVDRRWMVVHSPVGGAAHPDTLVRRNTSPEWVTPDGRYLGVVRRTAQNRGDLGMIDLEAPDTFFPIATRPEAGEVLSRISNDGRYVAYTSNQTGDYQVFVQTIPPSDREWQVSVTGGEEPLWSSGDEYIYWRYGDQLLRVRFSDTAGEPSFSQPEVVFNGTFENVGGYSIDIAPDNRILLFRSEEDVPRITHLEMISNFPALLESQ